MSTLLAFLAIIIPQVPKLAGLTQLPALLTLFKSTFERVGGDGADFDQILADNQLDIDRLGDPDSFRKTAPAVTAARPKKVKSAAKAKKAKRRTIAAK